jgi:hypothetical protein
MPGLAQRTITTWSAVVVALALLLAALPLVLFPDAGANDGAGPMTAIFGIPMVATAALIHLALLRRGRGPFVVRLLPWVAGIVLGMLFLAIPATLADRAYYTAETLGGMLATLAGFAVIAAIGAGCGIVLWFLVMTPAASLVVSVMQAWRGESVRPALIAIPAGILAAEIGGLVLIVAFNVDDLTELVVVQIVGALFGLAGLYPVTSEVALWVVRALVVAVLSVGILLTVSGRPRDQAPA